MIEHVVFRVPALAEQSAMWRSFTGSGRFVWYCMPPPSSDCLPIIVKTLKKESGSGFVCFMTQNPNIRRLS